MIRAYHLLGAQYAINDLALRRLKVSRYNDLNDPFELAGIDVSDPRNAKVLTNVKEKLHQEYGCICFSKGWSNPVLWSHYAEKHFGVALGFDIDEGLLENIRYVESLFNPRGKPNGRPKVDDDLIDALLKNKFVDWQYEDEIRMRVDLKGSAPEFGNHFIGFSSELVLREIVLGIRCELSTVLVNELVAKFDPAIAVIKTRAAPDRFQVIVADDGKSAATLRRENK